MMKLLVIGRLVRYTLAASDLPESHAQFAGESIPALVTQVHENGVVTLTAFPDFKRLGLLPCVYLPERSSSGQPVRGCWHWPPEFSPESQKAYKEKKKKAPATPAAEAPTVKA